MKLIKHLLLIFAFVAGAVQAQNLAQGSAASIINAFRFYKEITTPSIVVPTTVEVPFTAEYIERLDFAIVDRITNSFEPYFFKQETLLNEVPVVVSANPYASSIYQLNDKNTRTYADFPLPDNAEGYVQITLSSAQPIIASTLAILLDVNVALPSSIEIRAVIDEQNRIVVANRRMDSQTIRFPQTTSNTWTITLMFNQPLRISELKLFQDNATQTSARAIRFLAQPMHVYRIYFDPDRSVTTPVGEAGNLAYASDILSISNLPSQNNPQYVIADEDGDGVPNIIDNCVFDVNADQEDVNKNDRGDVCDDFDQDGLTNSKDNCPSIPNRNQQDVDSDNVGDVGDNAESRITERYVWFPWVGIGFAALVLIFLFILTARSTRLDRKERKI